MKEAGLSVGELNLMGEGGKLGGLRDPLIIKTKELFANVTAEFYSR